MAKSKVFRALDKIEKDAKYLVPDPVEKVAKKVTQYVNGKMFRWKFKPYNVLEVAELIGYGWISEEQKKFLVDLWGLDPEVWPTDWTEVVLEIGQGGGKNTVMEISVIYVLLWLVACENPYKVLGYFANKSIAESQNIDITNNSAVSECVPLDSEILTKTGWKKYSEVQIGEMVLTYNCEKDETEWQVLQNVTVVDDMPVQRIFSEKWTEFRATVNHKWAIQRHLYYVQCKGKTSLRHPHSKPRGPYKNRQPDRYLGTLDSGKPGYRVVIAAKCNEGNFDITPDECAIIGWVLGDGTIQKKGNYRRLCIYQSKDKYMDDIRQLMKRVDENNYEVKTPSRGIRVFPGGRPCMTKDAYQFYLSAERSKEILKKAGINDNLDNLISFVTSLNYECREAMLNALMMAEGDEKDGFAQKKQHVLDVFQILATMQGNAVGKPQLIENETGGCTVQTLRKTRRAEIGKLSTEFIGNEKVWCPTTENGTWVMRQNGRITITGNSQAKTVFFDNIKQKIKAANDPKTGKNLFEEYISFNLQEEGKGDIKAKVIEFPNFFEGSGHIRLFSLDSGVATFEGKNILLALEDEPSRANTQTTYENAKALWKGLTGNTKTRYPNGVGKTGAFSYPNTSEFDLTHELVQEELDAIKAAAEKGVPYPGSNRKVFVKSTFEFNPSVSKSDPGMIRDYLTDPEDALARYECIKSRGQNAFFKPHIPKIKECATIENKISYSQVKSQKKMKTGEIAEYSSLEIYKVTPDDKYRVWAVDTSVNKDRFVLGSAYSEEIEASLSEQYSENTTELKTNRKVVNDILLVWSPTKALPVDYDNVHRIIDYLLDMFPNSVLFGGDKFQTESIKTYFENRGIKSELFSFSTSMQFQFYSAVRMAVFNDKIAYVKNNLLIEELERLQKIGDNKVDHSPSFSKDAGDNLAILYKLASSLDYGLISSSGGLDRYRDAKLINMCETLIGMENDGKDDGYICEKMNISQSELELLKNKRQEFFPAI